MTTQAEQHEGTVTETVVGSVSDLFSPESLDEMEREEGSYRRGVSQALSLAGDLVRGGATADDLDELTDLSMDWRSDQEAHLGYLDELVRAWRRGERGKTGLDLRDLDEPQPQLLIPGHPHPIEAKETTQNA